MSCRKFLHFFYLLYQYQFRTQGENLLEYMKGKVFGMLELLSKLEAKPNLKFYRGYTEGWGRAEGIKCAYYAAYFYRVFKVAINNLLILKGNK